MPEKPQIVNGVFTDAAVYAMSVEQREALKLRCQTDLYFLADKILRSPKHPPLVERVHAPIARAMVQKDPKKPYYEWSPIKQRVILSSRGTLKTVLEQADIVQIILCDPNIRILLLSGKLDQAQSILKVVRDHFLANETLRALFPEWCSEATKINAEEFTSSARNGVNYREPTLSIATFGSVKAGGHYEWLKLDDCTNEINCANEVQVEKTINDYDDLDPLLEPGGYKDLTATIWAENDLPQVVIQRGEEWEKEHGEKLVESVFQPIWVLKIDPDPRKQAQRLEREKFGNLKPADVNLLWPEKLNAQFLWPQYRANRQKFERQYLLKASGSLARAFTQQLLTRQTKPIEVMPQPHKSWIFQNWDTAGVSGRGDFCVGVTAVWEDTRRMFLTDARVERYTSSTALARDIVLMFKKWMPVYRCRIEDANGARLLEGELKALAKEMGVPLVIDWKKPENTADAKKTRIFELAGAMDQGLVEMWDGMPYLSELYQQFKKFTGSGKYKDDGPDCIAQLWKEYSNQIYPLYVPTMKPSGKIIHEIPFEEELPAQPVDPHAEERENADIAWLRSFTTEH